MARCPAIALTCNRHDLDVRKDFAVEYELAGNGVFVRDAATPDALFMCIDPSPASVAAGNDAHDTAVGSIGEQIQQAIRTL